MSEQQWALVTSDNDGKTEKMRVEGGYIYRTSMRYVTYGSTGTATMAVSMVFVPCHFAAEKVTLADD